MTKSDEQQTRTRFAYIGGGCACARCTTNERKQLTTSNTPTASADEKWKQMRFPRTTRVPRKIFYTLVAATLLTFIYNQVQSYSILSQTNINHVQFDAASCTHSYQEDIDVVYTWVNGSEERLQADIRRYAGEDMARPDAYAPQRFNDKHELKYSLRSLEKHMPWVRHVYIVTNGQIPSWLDLDYSRVTIVTHEEIFQDGRDLPTFSSPAIEANLHRIPGLSDKFVYFNDDVFLNEDVYPEDFYTRNRGFKIYTAWGAADCARKCDWNHIGNGKCDVECFNAECDFDHGDCNGADGSIIGTTNTSPIMSNIIPPSYSPFLAQARNQLYTNASIDDYPALSERIKRYNNEQIKRQKLLRIYQRENEYFHTRTMNRLAATLFPGEQEPTEDLGRHGEAARKDLYSSSLIFTQMLLSRTFGFQRRNVIAHAPIMIDRNIMAEVQERYPIEFAKTIASKFRNENNLQIAFVYSYYLSLAKAEKRMADIFDEYDTDHSGTWSDREIHTLLTRIYPLPLKIEVVLEFQHLLNNCTESLTESEREIELQRPTPRYERYVDSLLSVVTKKMVIHCAALRAMLKNHEGVTHRGKYRHEFVEATEHVSFNQLHSVATAALNTLNSIRKTPRKFVCINDDLDRTNATRLDNELLLTLLEDLFVSLFPMPSRFELPLEYRNRFARMEELRMWQKWRWRWRGDLTASFSLSYFVVIAAIFVLVVLVAVFRIISMSWGRLRFVTFVQLKINTKETS